LTSASWWRRSSRAMESISRPQKCCSPDRRKRSNGSWLRQRKYTVCTHDSWMSLIGPNMWTLMQSAPALSIAITFASGSLAGWLLAWLYFRLRIWVMEQRLSDYAERRGALNALEQKRLVWP